MNVKVSEDLHTVHDYDMAIAAVVVKPARTAKERQVVYAELADLHLGRARVWDALAEAYVNTLAVPSELLDAARRCAAADRQGAKEQRRAAERALRRS